MGMKIDLSGMHGRESFLSTSIESSCGAQTQVHRHVNSQRALARPLWKLGVRYIAATWKGLWTWLKTHRADLTLSFRTAMAALLSLAVAHLLHVPLPLWTVLTTVILTQMSVGRSMKATIDYLLGTVGGAVYTGALSVLIPHNDEIALLGVLALAVGPLALLAAIRPSFSAAPVTGVLVLLAPTIIHVTPIASALDRVIEVTLGAIIGLIVSLLVLPARARVLAFEAARRMLDLAAELLPDLFAGFSRTRDPTAIVQIQDKIGGAFEQLEAIAAEAKHEGMAYLYASPDFRPLLRTLLRLRHDFVMIGRTASDPLPEDLQARFAGSLARITSTTAEYLRGLGAALTKHRNAPSPSAVETALRGYAADMAALRRAGAAGSLPDDAAERIFALAFALEQLGRDLDGLAHCVNQFAQRRAASFRIMTPRPGH
jgi:uncharacterized membrane protein YccC